jgi:uncharacterized protein (TIGR01777 family)
MNILIAGGTGHIGKKLQKSLLEKGHHLFILSRNPSENNSTPLFIQWDGVEVPQLPAEMDAVINLCGASIASDTWTEERKKILLNSRIQPTKALLHYIELQTRKPAVFLNASAVGIYGSRQFELLTENSKEGEGYLAELSQGWEEAAQNTLTRTVLLRTGIVLDNQSGALPEAIKTFPLGFGGYFGKGNQGFPWIHMDDEVGLIIHALENTEVEGFLNLVGPETVSYKTFIELASAIKSKLVLPAPEFVLQFVLGSRSDLLLSSQYVYPEKAVKTGYQFKYPTLKSALENLL